MTVKIKTELEGGAYDLLKYDVKTGEWKRIRSAIVDENGYATFIVVNYGEYKITAFSDEKSKYRYMIWR